MGAPMDAACQSTCDRNTNIWSPLAGLFVSATLAAALILNTGCTYVLWNSEIFENRKEPAADPRLQLFEDQAQDDYVVEYLELDESSGKVRYRIYYLLENDLTVQSRRKPRFLKEMPDSALTEIPVLPHPETTNELVLPATICAVMSADNNGFTLFLADGSRYTTPLPEYSGRLGRAGQVLLTPVTVAIDAAVASAVIFLILWANSNNSSWD